MEKLFRQRKGQSAIEYLTTYGWMLLVIAIVGGAIFTTVQGNSNLSSVTGFQGEDVQITNFGLDSSDNLQMEIRAQTSEQATIREVILSNDGNSASNTSVDKTIDVGETKTVTLTGVSSDSVSNDFDVEIVYDTGGLSNLTVNGTMTGSFTVQ
ncbi:hypothetical protein [Candidatus Nanohalobium constans]|uniref:Uncharacterized protein n=1 Tax=Candidatus Nanohalobium constans TaxID=2565781 RepID=A0A5Q0UI38_9ARCH|nr:hypothetical protein [Candidatus Nanohalobium constans]QGA81001.1 hypothetical protein LC1Nh_1133 [Candidatus Nanohalobium constans]